MTIPAERLAESHHRESSSDRAALIKWFAIIFAVSFILRIAYAGHLYEDDGLWFTAGEEILRGKTLYRDIYFDKPPGLPLVYAALFGVFGAHILTIRLFTILYTVAVSLVLYKFGSSLYDKRTGRLCGAMFAVFSTTYSPGHFQGLNTDLLMVLPYTAGALLMARSRVGPIGDDSRQMNRGWLATAGGALAGVAFQINPKGAFDLIFFAVILWTASRRLKLDPGKQRQTLTSTSESFTPFGKRSVSAPTLFALGAAGFAAVSLATLGYAAWTGSLASYWLYVWDWGTRYGRYYPAGTTLLAALTRSAGYFALNNTLLVTLIFVAGSIFKRRAAFSNELVSVDGVDRRRISATSSPSRASDSDSVLLIWFAVSFAGVMLGGRLFPHYFFQVLPSLCLIGGRGLFGLAEALKTHRPNLRRATAALIAVGFLFTLVRFHGRSVMLLADWGRGNSEANARWYYEERNQEERLVARAVTVPLESDSEKLAGVRAFGPRNRPVEGAADYLFVWGYRPEIYYWSGLLPASRYLSTQPLTGVPADVHYFGDDYRTLLPDDLTEAARAQLLRDLEETRPKYIVDELGFFNSDLSIKSYPELREFMTAYRPLGRTGRFFIYLRRDFSKKYRERHAKPD